MAASMQTLVTFLVETTEPAHSVQLLGSWDNFSTPYSMRRDKQKGPGHWFGCFKYAHIICDGDPSQPVDARQGRLLMGGTYWYYYRLNDHTEFHNATEPSTTLCPLLPGQAVNILEIPHELTPSIGESPAKAITGSAFTLDPEDRYVSPVPPSPSRILRSSDSLINARRFFARSRESRCGSLRSRLQTAPGIIASAFDNKRFGDVTPLEKPTKFVRRLNTSAAAFWPSPAVKSQAQAVLSRQALLMRSGTLKSGRPATGSETFDSFLPQVYGKSGFSSGVFQPVDRDYSRSDMSVDYRPLTWAGDSPPMDVGYNTRRAVSEPAGFEASLSARDLDLTRTGQPNYDSVEFGFDDAAWAESLDLGVQGQDASIAPDFSFADGDESKLFDSEYSLNPHLEPSPRLYFHENVTAFRLSSLQTQFDDNDDRTPRLPDRTFSNDSFKWTTTSASSSAASGARRSTYSSPTDSIDGAASLRYFESSDKLASDVDVATPLSSTSLNFVLMADQPPLLPHSHHEHTAHLTTPRTFDFEYAKSTETLLPAKPAEVESAYTLPQLEPTPDLLKDLNYFGSLVFSSD